MKHLESYQSYNEELNSIQKRAILNIPRFIGMVITYLITKSYVILNFTWDEMKKTTTDKNYPALLFGSPSSPEKITTDIRKINRSDLPSNHLGYSMFFRRWNLYEVVDIKHLSNNITNRTDDERNQQFSLIRPVVFISRDELKKGDTCKFDRLFDNDIYSYFRKKQKTKEFDIFVKSSLPIIIMVAKYDNVEKVKEKEKDIKEICFELSDDYPVEVTTDFDISVSELNIKIDVFENRKLYFTNELSSRLEEVAERIVDYLKIEKFKRFKYKISYQIEPYFFYYGNKGRFKEDLIKKINKSSNGHCYLSDSKCFNISQLSRSSSRSDEDDCKLYTDDLKTLMSDMENCYNRNNIIDRKERGRFDPNLTEIKLQQINIWFKLK